MQQNVIIALCSVIALFSWVPSLEQNPGVTLEIGMLGDSSGGDIRLDVFVRNSTAEKLHVWKASPQVDGQAEAYLAVDVRDSEGKPVPRTDGTFVINGKKHYLKFWLLRKGVYVEPHDELHDYLVLSKLFDLSKPGRYTVSTKAAFELPGSEPEIKWFSAESNTINFVVKQPGLPPNRK